MSYSIVIPSRNIANLTKCVRTLRGMGETARVIVVDDGCQWDWENVGLAMAADPHIEICSGRKPFVFAANVNIGIAAAGTADVVLFNDDALLMTYHGIQTLSDMCIGHGYGALCPGFTPAGVGTPNLRWRGRTEPVEEHVMLVFACVYIPRSTIDRVGLLDERFGSNAGGKGARGYGLEDDDYSLRIRQSGLKLAVYDGVLVDHDHETTGLKSTFRHDPEHPHDVRIHEDLFREKHGHWPEGHGYAPGRNRKP